MLRLPLYVGIILKKDDEIFLIQRSNTNWMSGYWNFPGGLVKNIDGLINKDHYSEHGW